MCKERVGTNPTSNLETLCFAYNTIFTERETGSSVAPLPLAYCGNLTNEWYEIYCFDDNFAIIFIAFRACGTRLQDSCCLLVD